MSAVALKDEGNALFASGRVTDAVAKYHEALTAIGSAGTPTEVGTDEAMLAANIHNNLAACYLKLEQPELAFEQCDKALAIDSGLVKARYRRAQALERLGRIEEALHNFRELMATVPAAKSDAQRNTNFMNLSKLPASEVSWLVIAAPMRGWIKDKETAQLARPWALCVVRYEPAKEGESDVRGLVGLKRLVAPPTSDDVTFVVLDSIARAKARPTRVTFQERDFAPKPFSFLTAAAPCEAADAVAPVTARISKLLQGIGVEVVREATAEVMESLAFAAFLSSKEFPELAAKQIPGILASGASPIAISRCKDLFTNAAEWFSLSPWRSFGATDVLAVTVSAPHRPPSPSELRHADAAEHTYYVVVMGQTGMTYGICVYDDVNTVKLAVCGQKPPAGTRVRSVRFEALEDVPCFEDLDVARENGWPIAARNGFPVSVDITYGDPATQARPSSGDVQLLAHIFSACTAFQLSAWKGTDGRGLLQTLTPLEPASHSFARRIKVAEVDMEVDVSVSYPAFGDIGQFDSGTAATPSQLGSDDQQESWYALDNVVNGRLDEAIDERGQLAWLPCGDDALDQAQSIIRSVVFLTTAAAKKRGGRVVDPMLAGKTPMALRNDRILAAYRALELSKKCSDAYVELVASSQAANLTEAVELLEKAVDASKWCLESAAATAITEGKGWSHVHVRPHMRALFGLGRALCQAGRYTDACDVLSRLLGMDATDPLRQAPVLVETLLRCAVTSAHSSSVSASSTSPCSESTTSTRSTSPEPACASINDVIASYEGVYGDRARWAYTTALHKFSRAGDIDSTTTATVALLKAFTLNLLVPPYLIGDKAIDGAMPASTGHAGQREEAVSIASTLFDLWQVVPGAVSWCASLWKGNGARLIAEAATATPPTA